MDWNRIDSELMPRDYITRDGILYINNVRHEDAGKYECTGTNHRNGQIIFNNQISLVVTGNLYKK